MRECPYCGKIGMSVIDKLFSGPLVYRECRNCGKRIGVSWSTLLLLLPALFLLVFQRYFLTAISMSIPFSLFIIVVFGFAYIKFIPIVKKESGQNT